MQVKRKFMPNRLIKAVLPSFIGLSLFHFSPGIQAADKHPVGWVEQAAITENHFLLHAKIDSGADNSSINTVNPVYFEQSGQRWVKFSITNREGQSIELSQPIVKTTRIKTKSGGYQQRDVIELPICLGRIKKSVPVNLVDRSHFRYQLLIGRSFLRPDFLIDSDSKYLSPPKCS